MLDTKNIIEKMKAYEIKCVENRYENLEEERVTEIFDMAENKEEVQFLQYNMDILSDLIFGGVYMDRDILRTHVFINSSLDFRYNLTVEESSELAESILNNGIGLCQSHIFYTDKEKLEEVAKRVLNDRLDDPEYVKKYFSKEEIIDLWVQDRDKDYVIDQLIFTHDIESLLELTPAVAFTTSDDVKVYYSYIDHRFYGGL